MVVSRAKKQAARENRLKRTLKDLGPPPATPAPVTTRSAVLAEKENQIREASIYIEKASRAIQLQQLASDSKTAQITNLRDTTSSQQRRLKSQDAKISKLNSKLNKSNGLLESKTSDLQDDLQNARNRCTLFFNHLRNSQKRVFRMKKASSALHSALSSTRSELEEMKKKLTRIEVELQFQHRRTWELLRTIFDIETKLRVAQDEHRAILSKSRKIKSYFYSVIDSALIREEKLHTEITLTCKQRKAYRMHLSRVLKTVKQLKKLREEVVSTLEFKEKGVYKPAIRSLVRSLVELSCPLANVGRILSCFIEFTMSIDLAVLRRLSERKKILDAKSVRRIVEEGSVASDAQLGLESVNTKLFTVSGDGTMHRNQTYESLSMNNYVPESYVKNENAKVPRIRMFGVQHSKDHKADTQREGELDQMKESLSIFARSPLAQRIDLPDQPLNENFLAMKLAGRQSDHSEDQKALFRQYSEWKKEHTEIGLGEIYFHSLPENEQLRLASESEKELIEMLGGENAWEDLEEDEKKSKKHDCMINVLKELAGEAYLKLSGDERRQLDHWIFARCGMHKELNSVKGGVTGMKKAWDSLGFGPVLLMNKDNEAAYELAEGDEENSAGNRAVELSIGGAVKLCCLIGALLNHKDDKKGQHDIFRYFFKEEFGRTFTFSDTSNTRYSSYLDASAEIIKRLDFYIEYMHHICDSKEKPGLNHLEANVLKGLQDLPTRTELAVLTLYQEAISHPYIRKIRSSEMNALDQGPLHHQVQEHIKKLINSPELILTPNSEPEQAKLGGLDFWKHPDAIESIWEMASTLPKLREMFVTFLKEALTTWERFSAEFNNDGKIAGLTTEDKKEMYLPATNDANEGTLGSFRVFARRYPSANLDLFNAIFRMRRNGMEDFIKGKLTGEDDLKFLRKEARLRLASKRDRKKRRYVTEWNKACVIEKRRKTDERNGRRMRREEYLKNLELVEIETIPSLTVARLKDQIDKLRDEDKEIPREKELSRKEDRARALIAALERYKIRHQTPG